MAHGHQAVTVLIGLMTASANSLSTVRSKYVAGLT